MPEAKEPLSSERTIEDEDREIAEALALIWRLECENRKPLVMAAGGGR